MATDEHGRLTVLALLHQRTITSVLAVISLAVGLEKDHERIETLKDEAVASQTHVKIGIVDKPSVTCRQFRRRYILVVDNLGSLPLLAALSRLFLRRNPINNRTTKQNHICIDRSHLFRLLEFLPCAGAQSSINTLPTNIVRHIRSGRLNNPGGLLQDTRAASAPGVQRAAIDAETSQWTTHATEGLATGNTFNTRFVAGRVTQPLTFVLTVATPTSHFPGGMMPEHIQIHDLQMTNRRG